MYIVHYWNLVNLCDFYYEWIIRISSERSDQIQDKFRIQLNPRHVPEIKDCPGKSKTGGHLKYAPHMCCYHVELRRCRSNHIVVDRHLGGTINVREYNRYDTHQHCTDRQTDRQTDKNTRTISRSATSAC